MRSLAEAGTDAPPGLDIRVAGVAKGFGSYPALHDVDLNVRAGELLALLGPSGSGKTTLLRILAGLENPDRGSVMFGGVEATRLSVQERRVGMVFQHYALFRHMTVFDNVAYGLTVRSWRDRPSRRIIRDRVFELLDLVQLSGLDGRYPSQLSGGQRQRVALARALAIEPRVLLLDEPFGALDARVRKDLRRWLREVHRKTGLTTLFVTHDQDEAMELADRVAVLNKGRIEQVGSPDELYDAPASAFVMSFIGEAVGIEVVTTDGVSRIGERRLPSAPSAAPEGASRIFLRPSDLKVSAPDAGVLTGTVMGVRRTQTGHRVEVAVDTLTVPVEVDISDPDLRIGQTIGLAVTRMTSFDAGGTGAP